MESIFSFALSFSYFPRPISLNFREDPEREKIWKEDQERETYILEGRKRREFKFDRLPYFYVSYVCCI